MTLEQLQLRFADKLLCAEHLNAAERGDVPPFEQCIVCIRIERDELSKRLTEHRKAVGVFLSEMYCLMIDPLAEEPIPVMDMIGLLKQAATEQRQQLQDLLDVANAYNALDEQRNTCEECEDHLERAPETCELCFPFADRARLLMRKALGIAQPEAFHHYCSDCGVALSPVGAGTMQCNNEACIDYGKVRFVA